MMDAGKNIIVSFPAVKDIYFNQKLSYPALLADGFLLDRRGIGPDVAFLNITYEDYAKYEGTPAVEELQKRILDRDPLLEMYDCGPRSSYNDPETEISRIISEGRLHEFKRIK